MVTVAPKKLIPSQKNIMQDQTITVTPINPCDVTTVSSETMEDKMVYYGQDDLSRVTIQFTAFSHTYINY